MSIEGGSPGLKAITALIAAEGAGLAVADKDWAAAAGLIARKILVSGGQTATSLNALRAAVGEEIFESQLKALTPHQARLLARRLDKTVPDFEVSTARAAIAHVRTLLAPAEGIAPPTEDIPEDVAEPADTSTDDPPPTTPNPYFGRKSFRTG